MKNLQILDVSEDDKYIKVTLKHPLSINTPVLIFAKTDLEKVMNDIPPESRKRTKIHLIGKKHIAISKRDSLGTEWTNIK